MKVFILKSSYDEGQFEDFRSITDILGVYSSLELANKAQANEPKTIFCDYHESYSTDKDGNQYSDGWEPSNITEVYFSIEEFIITTEVTSIIPVEPSFTNSSLI